MKICIFCSGVDSLYAKTVLTSTSRIGIRVDALAYQVTPFHQRLARRIREYRAGGRLLWQRRQNSSSADPVTPDDVFRSSLLGWCAQNTVQTYKVHDLNGKQCQNFLHSIRPDVIVLAGAPIIRFPILKVPPIGVINAHAAVLPYRRGMNVAEWSVLEEAELGITVHFVNPGIDLGDIILISRFDAGRCVSIAQLRDRVRRESAMALADALECLQTGNYERKTQQRQQGRQYFAMHPNLRDLTERKLREHHRKAA
jgi:folate-dependent phosphoribosylglycinamide formyltransferase PurN